MSLVVGLTGGIGSGKTTVAKYFNALDVPVYNADDEAKKIMMSSKVRSQIIAVLGENAYTEKGLDRALLRAAIFGNDEIRLKINSIVHPAVAKHFQEWVLKQSSPYVIKESALIFEIGIQDQYDLILLVVADKDERISRLLSRPGMTTSAILSIMDKQWSDKEKLAKSDFVIPNNDHSEAGRAVLKIHTEILRKVGRS